MDAYRLYRDFLNTLYDTINNHLPNEIGMTGQQFEDLMSDVHTDATAFYNALVESLKGGKP